MKDQIKLLRTCINNDVPAVVFQGDDKCAPQILEAALNIYRQNGCSAEFVYDFQLLINEVKAYQKESPDTVKIPGLSASEAELIREDMNNMNNRKAQVFHSWKQEAQEATYEEYSLEKIISGKFGIVEYGADKTRIYGLLSDRLYNHDNNVGDTCWVYPLTGGCFSMDMKTGIRHEGARIVGIEIIADEVAKVRYDTLLELAGVHK